MAAYTPGEMDITEQKKTFDGFVRTGTRFAVVVALTLILLAIFVA